MLSALNGQFSSLFLLARHRVYSLKTENSKYNEKLQSKVETCEPRCEKMLSKIIETALIYDIDDNTEVISQVEWRLSKRSSDFWKISLNNKN